MGTSTDGILAYGYDLDEDFGLDYDALPDWYDEDKGYEESAKARLLAEVGFTETNWRADGYFDRKREAEQRVGVEFERHCSRECPMYIIAAKVQSANRGYPEVADLTLPDNADERLAWALGVLGIKPKAEKPQWLLASWWG